MFGLAGASRKDVVGRHREVISDDQVVLFIRPRLVRDVAGPWARNVFVIRDFRQGPVSLRTPPPDAGSAATERHSVLIAVLRAPDGAAFRGGSLRSRKTVICAFPRKSSRL